MLQSSGDKLQQIEVLLKAGDKPEALRLLVDYLRLNPTSPRAWWLMSQAVTDPGQKVDCLERLLQLDPGSLPRHPPGRLLPSPPRGKPLRRLGRFPSPLPPPGKPARHGPLASPRKRGCGYWT
jgi:hypothetical protein